MAYLTQREINGYTRLHLPVRTTEGVLHAHVFIGTSDNPQFSPLPDDDAGLDAAARHIARSSGPSGRNDAYLFDLESSLLDLQREVDGEMDMQERTQSEEHGCGDWYVAELARRVRKINAACV